ncbi:phospholipid carrier-dependent glycosyltransferase [Parathermosynechococcus lividus]
MPLGLLVVWLFALGTRLWGLGRFNTLVFDEVYFARFARNYLAGEPFFDAHPPFGKYLIALGIWLAGGFQPWGYRWLNAVVGSLIPVAVALLAYLITRRQRVGLMAGTFVALDGFFLVESRYALINVYLVFLGVVAQVVWLWGQRWKARRWLALMGTGVALGACVAVKWSGLGFLLGLWLVWGVQRWWMPQRQQCYTAMEMVLILPLVVFTVYSLLWLPHLAFHPHSNLWQVHVEMFNYHRSVASTAHPYCAPWWSWPLLLRPLSYFFQRVQTLSEAVPVIGPPLPMADTAWVYVVHAMFNPPLLWLSTLAMLAIIPLAKRSPVGQFLLLNYAANFLPWVLVGRCLFLYHYLPAALYSFIALAVIWDWAWRSPPWGRALSVVVLLLIVSGFLYWLPVYWGLPLTPQQFFQRMWWRSWV